MTLLEVAESLYNEANDNFHSMNHGEVKQAFECLYAGLELVLPTAIELKFRILLARLLTRVNQSTRSREQLQKCHQLIQVVSYNVLVIISYDFLVLIERQSAIRIVLGNGGSRISRR